MRSLPFILMCLAASAPTTAFAQSHIGTEASSEAVAAPRASRVGNPDSPRNLLRRALIQAAKNHAAPMGAVLPKGNQLAVVTVAAQ